jgi:hypothetical protein
LVDNMATGKSGSFTIAGNEGFTAKLTWTESYDIAANTSVVSLNLAINSSTYRGTYYLAGSLKVNGSSVVNMNYYSPATHRVEVSAGSTYYQVQAQSGTAPPWASAAITHNSDGSKSVSISVNIEGWREDTHMFKISGTKTITLTTIARTSTLTASNGTLGTAQTLSISRQSSSFTHSIRYDCGAASGAIVTKTANTSVSFTPSLNLAQQNTTGTSVSVTFTLYTFSGDTEIGRTTKTITCAIPASVKPSCALSVTDKSGHVSTYGGYVQGISGAEVIVTPTIAQGSPIASYSVTADGKSYTNSDIEIPFFSQSGTLTISATVKDKRSRSGSASKTVTVLPYSAPNISHLSVMRCNEDGTENIAGLFAKVTYSHSITTLSNKNAKTVKLKYKKTSETAYTTVTLTSAYTSSNASYIFEAADDASYNVSIEVTDAFNVSTKSTSVSTASVLMHVRADGTGMAFGKISEKANALEFGKEMYDRFGSLIGAGLSAYGGGGDAGIDPNTTLDELCLTSHTNAPQGLGTFYYIQTVFYNTKSATAARAQIAFPYNKTGAAYHRYYASGAWSAWAAYSTDVDIPKLIYSASGTSSGWSYRKWQNGFAECWAILSGNSTNYATGGSEGYRHTLRVNYPFTFTVDPTVLATIRPGTGCGPVDRVVSYESYATVGFNANLATLDYAMSVYVIGNWK